MEKSLLTTFGREKTYIILEAIHFPAQGSEILKYNVLKRLQLKARLCKMNASFSGPKVAGSDFSTATPLDNGATMKDLKNGSILLVNNLM